MAMAMVTIRELLPQELLPQPLLVMAMAMGYMVYDKLNKADYPEVLAVNTGSDVVPGG
jgi:hypothetical protein